MQFNIPPKFNYITEHTHFDWVIDFKTKQIQGSVLIKFNNVAKDESDLLLNINYLNILSVCVNDQEQKFTINPISNVGALGSHLTIPIKTEENKFEVKIRYNTTDECTALQWMTAEMTKGKKHPYLYSQCQAIHARSLFPCQDEPSVKFTYSAEVKADSALEVLMSAVKCEPGQTTMNGSLKVHRFEQKVKIPSYLVAVVCGNLEGRRVGPRSTVWSEPEMVEEAANEFRDTESFLADAESICGVPYLWGVYDLLVLPPAFPYGGMENPCLTFVTPTLIVGDRSLVFVVAHEISHSWTGNLVTNKTWADFWLNEGHTRYVERLIMEKHYGKENEQRGIQMRHLLIDTGIACLQESLNTYGKDHNFNQMVPDLVNCDPDDSFSRVPYEKGSNLLFHLESVCGKDKMLRWLKAYLEKYKYGSLTTSEWKEFLYHYMTEVEKIPKSTLDTVDWEAWFHGRWTIPVTHDLNCDLVDQVKALAERWIDVKLTDNLSPDCEIVTKYFAFVPDQKYYFLQYLNDIREVKMPMEKLQKMGLLLGFTESTNPEILFGWSILCIRSKYEPALDQIFRFLNSQGRLKYTKPIYSELNQWSEKKEITKKNFLENGNMLHPITAKMVRKILGLL